MKAIKSLRRKSSASEGDPKAARQQLVASVSNFSSSESNNKETRSASASGGGAGHSSGNGRPRVNSTGSSAGSSGRKGSKDNNSASESSSGYRAAPAVPALPDADTLRNMPHLRFSGFSFDALIPVVGPDERVGRAAIGARSPDSSSSRAAGGPYAAAFMQPPSSPGGSDGRGMPLRSASGSQVDPRPFYQPGRSGSPMLSPGQIVPGSPMLAPGSPGLSPGQIIPRSPSPTSMNGGLEPSSSWAMPGTRELRRISSQPVFAPRAAMMTAPETPVPMLSQANAFPRAGPPPMRTPSFEAQQQRLQQSSPILPAETLATTSQPQSNTLPPLQFSRPGIGSPGASFMTAPTESPPRIESPLETRKGVATPRGASLAGPALSAAVANGSTAKASPAAVPVGVSAKSGEQVSPKKTGAPADSSPANSPPKAGQSSNSKPSPLANGRPTSILRTSSSNDTAGPGVGAAESTRPITQQRQPSVPVLPSEERKSRPAAGGPSAPASERRSASASRLSSKSRAKAASEAEQVKDASNYASKPGGEQARQRTTSFGSSAGAKSDRPEKIKRRSSFVGLAEKIFGKRKSMSDLSATAAASAPGTAPGAGKEKEGKGSKSGAQEGGQTQGAALNGNAKGSASRTRSVSRIGNSEEAKREWEKTQAAKSAGSGTTAKADPAKAAASAPNGKVQSAAAPLSQQGQARPNSQMPPQQARPNSQLPPPQVRPNSQMPPQQARPNSQMPPQQARPASQMPPQQARPISQMPPQQARPTSQMPPQQARPTSQLPNQPQRPVSQVPPASAQSQSKQPGPQQPPTASTAPAPASSPSKRTSALPPPQARPVSSVRTNGVLSAGPPLSRPRLSQEEQEARAINRLSLLSKPAGLAASSGAASQSVGAQQQQQQLTNGSAAARPSQKAVKEGSQRSAALAHDSDASEASMTPSRTNTESSSDTPATPAEESQPRFKANFKDAPVAAIPLASQIRTPQGIPMPQAASPVTASPPMTPSTPGHRASTQSPLLSSFASPSSPLNASRGLFRKHGMTTEEMFALRKRGFYSDGKGSGAKSSQYVRKVMEMRQYTEAKKDARRIQDTDIWEREEEIYYSEYLHTIFSTSKPKILVSLLSFMEIGDVKTIRQTCQGIRAAMDSGTGHELVLQRFLAEIGYRRWRSRKSLAPGAGEPQPETITLSFADVEGFIIGHDLLGEYDQVATEAVRNPQGLDPRIPRLARATTRSYNRVLARLRSQPGFRLPLPPSAVTTTQTPPRSPGRSPQQRASTLPPSSSGSSLSPTLAQQGPISRVNSYYPSSNPNDLGLANAVRYSSPLAQSSSPSRSPANLSPAESTSSSPFFPSKTPLPCPYKPGRAATWRVWVPSRDIQGGWLTDEELTRCEQELFKSGVWKMLKKGDVVWDCALSSQRNDGKYIFDGNFLR